MERPDSTSSGAGATAVVEDRAAAAVLLEEARLRFLRPFMLRECSTAEAASELGVSVKDMAYRVRRMAELGLLEATRERPRKGRSVRLYRAPSAFFVPFAAVEAVDMEAMVERLLDAPRRRLVEGLVHTLGDVAHDVHRWGWQLEVDEEQRISIGPAAQPGSPRPLMRSLLEPDKPALYMANIPLQLDHAAAKQLQQELARLVARFDGRGGPETYILTMGLAPQRTG